MSKSNLPYRKNLGRKIDNGGKTPKSPIYDGFGFGANFKVNIKSVI